MEKKYTFNDEDKEDNVVREPMAEYTRTSPAEYSHPLCPSLPTYTLENMKKMAQTAITQGKNGDYISHEEMLKKYLYT